MERIHMHYFKDIIYRLQRGESERQIARDLGLSRPTVHKYKLKAEIEGYLKRDGVPELAELTATMGPAPQPPRIPSSLEPYQDIVQPMLEQGMEMTAMWQRLRDDHGYTGSYSSVRRYVHRQQPETPGSKAVIRVHTEPGEEMQVDFGGVGKLYDPKSGKVKTAYVFVATLCYSRHQYAELVFDQKTATWIGLHRRAFEYFGGIPQRVKPDNLKAAVLQALVHDPILGEAYRRMALHYGFLISPAAPYHAQEKGKVESGVHYVQRNFMAGQAFADIDFANKRLLLWVENIAGVRDHGTTHQAPLYLFDKHERAALSVLPRDAFDLCEIRTVKVHPDCHVVINGSYYSVPYQWIGKKLDAYLHERMVEIYAGVELVSTHARLHQKGQWSTRMDDYPAHKAAFLMQTPAYCRKTAARIGPSAEKVVESMLEDRPLDRLRSVQAILRLEESVGSHRLDAACARAVHFGDIGYRSIKSILNAALDCQPLPEIPHVAIQKPFAFARKPDEFFPAASHIGQKQ